VRAGPPPDLIEVPGRAHPGTDWGRAHPLQITKGVPTLPFID